MTGIFLCTTPTNKKIWNQFPIMLKSIFREDAGQPLIEVCPIQQAQYRTWNQAVVVCQGDPPCHCTRFAGTKMVVIADASGTPSMLRMVRESMLPTITCGMSSCDTITLSSFCPDSAVITLQRAIEGFDGNVIEPQELPVRMEQSTDRFLLMALAAICFLLHQEHQMKDGYLRFS